MCAGLVWRAVHLRAICLMTLPSMFFLVFVESDMNENFVREPNVHEMFHSAFY